MEEDECFRMLDHLQQYVPHLEKLIAQLKDPKRKNRELQLNKLEGLHSMITDRKKKLKLDTLRKCEDVILKILHKVHPTTDAQFQPKSDSVMSSNMVKFLCKDPPERTLMANVLEENGQDSAYVRFQAARARLIEISTPASPSPPRDLPLLHKPIVIPTEKVKKMNLNPDDFQIGNWKNTFDADNQRSSGRGFADNYKSDKPDVYNQAGESLSTSSSKKIIFDRLGTRVDMSKPPLSMEDLELLTSPDRDNFFDDSDKLPIDDNYSMDELQDLRQVLQQKLQQDDRLSMPDLRNKLNNKEGTSRYKEKKIPLPVPPPADFNSKPKSSRVEKVYKDPDSKFGNLLSSIDERILGDSPPIKKKEKKEQSKDEKHGKRDSKSHEKDPKKSSSRKEHHSHDRKDSKEKKSHRDEKKDHKNDSKSKDKESDKHKSDKSKDKSKHHDKKSEEKSSKHSEGKESKKEFKFDLPMKSNNQPKSDDGTSHKTETKETPVYKRLADKYNPKPRKNSIETVEKIVTDTGKLVDTGQKIPVIDNIFSSILNSKDNTIINNTRAEIIRPIDTRPNDPRIIPDSRQMGDPRQIMDPRQMLDTRQMNDLRQIVDPRQMNDPRQSLFDSRQINDSRQLLDPRQINDSRVPLDHRQINDSRIPLDPRHINDSRVLLDPRQMNDSRLPLDPRQMNDPRQIGGPRQINDVRPRQMEFNQINEQRQNLSWFEPNTPNFESATEKPSLLGRSPLLKMINPIQRNPAITSPLLGTPTTPNNMQIGFPSNNPVLRQKEIIGQSVFVPPQHNIVNQNISTNHGGNTYMNTFILQNNVGSNIPHSQFNNPTPTFHPPVGPSKAFHPYDPIESSEYDLSKMQPTDFYSPTFTKVKKPLLSPPPTPAYQNRGPYGNQFPTRERPSYGGRPNTDSWSSENKSQWVERERNHPREREEPHRPVSQNRDPRIRARETKDRTDRPRSSTKEPRASVESRRKSVDERSFLAAQNKYDSLYSNTDKETFLSPLDSLYATGEEKAHKTGKGYGVQKFRIPKRRKDSIDKQQERDGKKDVKDVLEDIETLKQENIQEESSTESPKEILEVPDQEENKESIQQKDEDTASTSEVKNSNDNSKASPTEESMLANFLTKLITKSEKKELLSAIFSTLTDTISDQQKKKFKRIQQIVDSDSDDEKEETVVKTEPVNIKPEISKDDTQPAEETKVVDNIEAETKDSIEDEETKEEEEETKEEEEETKEEEDESPETDNESECSQVTAKPRTSATKIRRNRRRPLKKFGTRKRGLRSRQKRAKAKANRNNKKIEDTTEDSESPTKTGDVIETVGERIKSRRRNIKTPDNLEIPKSRRCRTELDMLHEDIKEMFIRDGVLTATGKRMCRMLKPEADTDSNSSRSLKTRSVTSLEEESSSPSLDSPKRRARASNPKVVIEKTDLTKLVTKPADESGSDSEPLQSRLLRRSRSRMDNRIRDSSTTTTTSDLSPSPNRRTRNLKSLPNYTEDTDEELPPQLSEPEEQPPKENVNEPERTVTPNEPPIISKEVITPNKKGGKKKKRAPTWASGVIKKRKRKQSSNPVTPTPSIDGDQQSRTSDLDEPLDTAAQDDNDSEIEYIEPDVSYYFDPQDKADCKICPFKGKMIVQHYKTTHPKHEVLISRISPDNAKKAIDEAIEKGYDEIEVPDHVPDSKMRRKKYTYQCRFCQVFFKNENSEMFFDHLTSHTGEYRFVCNFCPFKTANSKSLRSHHHTSHNANVEKSGIISPAYQAQPDFYIVFGYMCGECNFIQLDKAAVMTHVKIYHLGDNQKIYKISMSMIEVKPALIQSSEVPAKVIKETSELEKSKQIEEVKTTEEAQIITEKEAQIITEKEAEAPKALETSPIPESIQPPTNNKKPDIPAEIVQEDPTVFKYNGDYVQENMILEEQKQEKMKEINLTIIPRKKFTSNFLDRIKSRLDDKIAEAAVAVPNEETNETTPVFEEITMQSENSNEEEKVTKKSVNSENSEIKKPKVSEPKTNSEHNTEKPINNKNSEPISNIIERLQGKLKADTPVQPPPLTPINEFNINLLEPKTEDIVIQVGPVAASKKNSYILYICYMQSCMFSSINKSEFEIHCTTLHSTVGWDGFCNICNSKIGSFEVVNAFKHLINVHENELKLDGKVVIKTEPKEVENPVKSYIRMRRLSGDKLSENNESSRDKSDSNENKSTDVSQTDCSFKIVDVATQPEIQQAKVTEEEHFFPFQITNVVSLADNEVEPSNAVTVPDITNTLDSAALSSLAIINTTTNSATTNAISVPITTATPITFQLPIQTTSGGGYSLVLPVLSPLAGKPLIPVGKVSPTKLSVKPYSPVKATLTTSPKTYSNIKTPPPRVPPKKIMLKDTPLLPEEMVMQRKTPYALTYMLSEPQLIQLYKCPERNCTFSTDHKKPFEAHLAQHGAEFQPGKLVPCLYCNFKTDVEYFAVHCDIRHGRCQFCCSYCFYRAINQSYVEMHQERQHAFKPRRVLMVKMNHDAQMSQAQIQMPQLQSIIPLYVCGQLGCDCKFIYPDNFKEHLARVHKGIPLLCFSCQWYPSNPENAISHMQTHGIYHYHCRYCSFGGSSSDEIYKHLSNQHFALHPKIVVRQFIRDSTGKTSSEYSHKDPTSYDRMKVITDENFKYITPNARFDVYDVHHIQDKKLKPVKSLSATAATVVTKIPAPINTTTELSAVLKKFPKKAGMTLKIVEAKKPQNIVVEEVKNESNKQINIEENDSDVEIVDEEPSSSVKPLNAIQIASKQLTSTVRAVSPIVLNKFLIPPPDLLTLTHDIATSTPNKITKLKSNVTLKEPTVDQKKTADFIVIQPVADNISMDESTLDNDTTAADVDPLQLESEACTVIPEDSVVDVPTEHSFTEAKLDVLSNYSFTEDAEIQEFSDLTAEEATLAFSVDEAMKKQGLMGRDLFRCGFCRAGFETSSLFKAHVTKCVEINKKGIPRPYKCAHCIKAFKSLGTLSDHVRLHGTLRFSCSLCDFKHQHQLYVRSHLKNRHKITSVILTPVDPNKRCLDEDEFVVRPKISRQRSIDGTTGSKDLIGNSTTDETLASKPAKASYGPDEIAMVPIRPIFSREVKCSACGYLTKVRANLIRHLQFHTTGKEMPVPVSAPVNPVPCLEKNEKMFDKMTNLSLSSYNDAIRLASKVDKQEKIGISKEEEAQLPGFVPLTKRYVCGANLCDYLCLEESMLRYHLVALHSDESIYKCTHCEENLSPEKGVINVEFIIKHLRLHDLHLYKCRYCTFLHQLKHKVDKHVLEKHANHPPIVLIVRELEQEPEEPPRGQPEQQEEVKDLKEAKPWRCGMCKYRCSNKAEIISHANNKHEVVIQFKCALCQFTNNAKSAFTEHFENDHPGQGIDVIDAYYEVDETVPTVKGVGEGPHFDTTPLWQRDKNKFKHIRGIPLDESKLPKKSPMKMPTASDNLDKAIEAVASGTTQIIVKDNLKSLLKKPKTLKEKKLEIKITSENDVIEIDDEEEKSMASKVAGVTKNLFNRRMSDIENFTATTIKEKKLEEKPVEVTRRKSLPELLAKLPSQPLPDEDAVDITLTEIAEMDLETLKHSELTGTYGPFGKPSYKQFLCPLCSTFKTRKVEDITNHLYKELHYFRFVCTNCALTGITFNFLHRHSLKKHLTESIHPLSPNPRIEQWVQKVLAIQRRIIDSNESPFTSLGTVIAKNDTKSKTVGSPKIETKVASASPKVTSPAKSIIDINTPDSSSSLDSDGILIKPKSGPFIHQCQYCSYSCKANSDLRKHERRHWVQKPLKCGHCDVEGVTKYEVLQHAKRAHPTLEPSVIPVPMPSNPTIKPITRKRKHPKNSLDNSASSSDELLVKQSALETSVETIDSSPTKEDETSETSENYVEEDIENESEDIMVFVCNYCPKRCNSESETRQHWESMHKTKQPAFKYKKLMRSQLHRKGTLNYKCSYCEFIGHLEPIKRHIMLKHPNSPFSVFRYKCGYCGEYLRNVEKAKIHCKHTHGVAETSYINIDDPADDTAKEPESKPKDFVCEHCSMEFCLRKELVDHHKTVHSHLELNLAPDLTPHTSIQEEIDDKKMYVCPECKHASNSYAAMRDHLRNHNKPYECGYCPTRFTYPSLVKTHQSKDHPNLEYKCTTIADANKKNENLRNNLLVLTKDGTYEKLSLTKAPKRIKGDQGNNANKIRIIEGGSNITTNKTKKIKNTARKSTTQGVVMRVVEEGVSHYGNKPDLEGVDKIKANVSFMDAMLLMNIAQVRSFLNITPTLPLVDIVKYKDQL